MVAWFAGVFFLGRLLIYHREGLLNKQPDVVALMQKGSFRVWYIITLPAMILTVFFGYIIAGYIGAFTQAWMHFKFLLVMLFVGYNFYLNHIRIQLKNDVLVLSNIKLRLLNEVPFLFLIMIVFTVYMKSIFTALWSFFIVLGIIAVAGGLMWIRKRKQ